MARPSNFEKSDDQPQKRVRASEHARNSGLMIAVPGSSLVGGIGNA